MFSGCTLWFLGAIAASGQLAFGQLLWNDEFVPSNATGFVNGGINLANWELHLGDGSDFGIPGRLVGAPACPLLPSRKWSLKRIIYHQDDGYHSHIIHVLDSCIHALLCSTRASVMRCKLPGPAS